MMRKVSNVEMMKDKTYKISTESQSKMQNVIQESKNMQKHEESGVELGSSGRSQQGVTENEAVKYWGGRNAEQRAWAELKD